MTIMYRCRRKYETYGNEDYVADVYVEEVNVYSDPRYPNLMTICGTSESVFKCSLYESKADAIAVARKEAEFYLAAHKELVEKLREWIGNLEKRVI